MIIIDREYLPFWATEPFTKSQAFLDLVDHAAREKTIAHIAGATIELEPGQLCRGQESMAADWQWSREKVRRYLHALEKMGRIKQKSRQQTRQQTRQLPTVITICDYWVFSTADFMARQQARQQTRQDIYNINNNNYINTIKPVEVFPLIDGQLYPIYPEDIDRLSKNFPLVDIEAQIGSMAEWLIKNPAKQKTMRGIRSFIDRWLTKRQKLAENPQPAQPPLFPEAKQNVCDFMARHTNKDWRSGV